MFALADGGLVSAIVLVLEIKFLCKEILVIDW